MSMSSEGVQRHHGVTIGSVCCFLSTMSWAVTLPFVQARRDELGCDALCQGGLTSLRSGLGLLGSALIGRASDRFGRIPMLWLGRAAVLLHIALAGTINTLNGMWIALVPSALLEQTFSIMKALFSDYNEDLGGTGVDLAGSVGTLGMAVGFSFMAGPLLATTLASSYLQALCLSCLVTLLSAGTQLLLPRPLMSAVEETATSTTPEAAKVSTKSAVSGLKAFLTLPVLQTRGAQLLMCIRLLMALAFHMFMPIWQVSVKNRFNFGPKDHATLMGIIGLAYALSQGLVAKPLMKKVERDPTKLLLACTFLLGALRPFTLYTTSLMIVYFLQVPMIIALGVMNTAIATACSSLASEDQLGGLFGVLESVESIGGIIGPSLGGLLTKTDSGDTGALVAVLICYGSTFCLVALFFGRHVVAANGQQKKAL